MRKVQTFSKGLLFAGSLAVLTAAPVSAQQAGGPDEGAAGDLLTVYGDDLIEGPKIEGIITARSGDRVQITGKDGSRTVVELSEETDIRAKGGFLGLSKTALEPDALLNGLPVTVETLRAGDIFYASRVRLSDEDLEVARMVRAGTAQGFAEQAAATEALRGRVSDIDQYNIRGTANVYFDTGKWDLTPQDKMQLCEFTGQADAMDNALLLVVGYTDSTGSQYYNQILSERRAGRVVNTLQQNCGWKPWRMLTPTGMAEADPAADNMTEAGKAQNRRVAVNILVSKATEGL